MHGLLADLVGLRRSVGFRVLTGGLSCVVGIGSVAWDRLFAGVRRPSCIRSANCLAKSTDPCRRPVICSSTSGPPRWICFELARHVIGTEDGCFGAGSYVIAQKYLHGLPVWNALSTEDQQRVIGRTKLSTGRHSSLPGRALMSSSAPETSFRATGHELGGRGHADLVAEQASESDSLVEGKANGGKCIQQRERDR